MSMMMPPEAPPGMPMPPGGGGDVPPMDAMSSTPMPAEGGIEGLIAALQGGGMGGPPGMGGDMALPGGPPEEELGADAGMDAVDHIKQAMKHLMMAMAGEEDDERGTGIVKGMGALQALLGGEQKRQKILADAGG